jgi:hypothetical protein
VAVFCARRVKPLGQIAGEAFKPPAARADQRRVRVASLVVVLVLLVGVLAAQWSKRANERRLAAVASELAGRDVSIHCQSFWGELIDISGQSGSVWFDHEGAPQDVADLNRETCKSLARLAAGDADSDLACVEAALQVGSCGRDGDVLVHAVVTLAHESIHLRGERDEAATQCYAVQLTARTAQLLGVLPAQAAAVGRYALARQSNMPAAYQSSECRPGGALDLHPETAFWPTEIAPA